eukprot:scaffold6217_cov28-Cyclotella_meneghiniana.AAC.1
MKFHPNDIPRRTIRQVYDEECKEVFEDTLEIEKFTVCYSKPATIGSVIAKSNLYEVPGKEAYMSPSTLRAPAGKPAVA